MKITDNKIDALNIELKIEIEAADYAEAEKKRLSACRRKAEFKGFRKGMVPASLIKKVYGEQCLMESVNESISKGLDEYINGNSLHILGEPLPSENQPEQTWVDGGDFTFVFDIALYPEIKVSVEKEDTVPSYSITIAAKDKTEMIANLKKYYEEKKEEKEDDAIEKEVTERMKAEYRNEAEWRLNKDIKNFYVAKAGIELPETFLKRWLFTANQGKFTMEDIEKEFAAFAEDFKWQLVRGYLMKEFKLEVGENDIREAAEGFVSYQYAMYGLGNVPADLIKEAAVNMLQDQKQVDRLVESVEDQKVIAAVKEIMTLKSTKISAAKFRELK